MVLFVSGVTFNSVEFLASRGIYNPVLNSSFLKAALGLDFVIRAFISGKAGLRSRGLKSSKISGKAIYVETSRLSSLKI